MDGPGERAAVGVRVRRSGTTPRLFFRLLARASAQICGRCLPGVRARGSPEGRRTLRARFPGLGAPAPTCRRTRPQCPAGRPTRPAGRSARDHTADRWAPPSGRRSPGTVAQPPSAVPSHSLPEAVPAVSRRAGSRRRAPRVPRPGDASMLASALHGKRALRPGTLGSSPGDAPSWAPIDRVAGLASTRSGLHSWPAEGGRCRRVPRVAVEGAADELRSTPLL